MRLIILFICGLFLYSCVDQSPADFGIASDYYPPKHILEKGIVNKYYVTRFEDKQDRLTDIQYKEYKLINDTLITHNYNAGYELKSTRKFKFEDDIMKMISGTSIDSRNNKSDLEISSENYLVWNNSYENNLFHYVQESKYFTREMAITQDLVEDTMYLGLKTKKFTNDYKVIVSTSKDSTIYKGQDIRFLSKGKGDVFFRSITDNYTLIGELVEQIPIDSFDKLKNHGHHRIAYIDPRESLIKDPSFTSCNENSGEFFDYYNGDPDAHLEGRKGKKWSYVKKYLENDKIKDISAYLSVRFLVNCEGEIGYFTTEEADLDYNEFSFPKEAKMHLVELTHKMKGWQPTKIRGEARDSYAYIIYKIEDGKVTEILP